jgi:tetratricopeptide (TPR) repeat protein
MSDVQPLIDSLWDFNDPAASESRFREAIARADDEPARLALRTQLARSQGLQGKFDDGHATLNEVERDLGGCADDSRIAASRARFQLERGRLLNSSMQRHAALPLFELALHIAQEIHNDHLAIDAAHMIAIVHGSNQQHDLALEWNRKALETAEASPQPRARQWRGSLHNNIGWTLQDQGDLQAALQHFETALQCRMEQAKPSDIHTARWCVARCLRSLKQYDDALHIQQQLQREHEAANLQADGFVAEEIAECLQALNRLEEAKPYFARAFASLSQISWVASAQPERLKRLQHLSA